MTETNLNDGAVLRPGRPGDEAGILACIQALAGYEREPEAVLNTVEALGATLFGPEPNVFAHVVEKRGEIVGIAIWFLNYSTWTGRNGVWLEDLFVLEAERAHGYGTALLTALATICVERGYTRLEWCVLDWNTPSIGFYRSLGAVPMDEWTTFRLAGDALRATAGIADAAGGH